MLIMSKSYRSITLILTSHKSSEEKTQLEIRQLTGILGAETQCKVDNPKPHERDRTPVTRSKRFEKRSLAHTRRLFSYYAMGISVNEPRDPLCIFGKFPFMLDAYVAVACLTVVALDSRCAVAARHSFDTPKPAVVPEANSLGAFEHFAECRDGLAGGADAAG